MGTRAKMVAAMRKVTLANNEALARYAVEETGLGRYEDKLSKNRLVAEKTPGVEILRPVCFTGDDGLMITERAPYGVIAAITPCTNPTETIINNGIVMVSGGNAERIRHILNIPARAVDNLALEGLVRIGA